MFKKLSAQMNHESKGKNDAIWVFLCTKKRRTQKRLKEISTRLWLIPKLIPKKKTNQQTKRNRIKNSECEWEEKKENPILLAIKYIYYEYTTQIFMVFMYLFKYLVSSELFFILILHSFFFICCFSLPFFILILINTFYLYGGTHFFGLVLVHDRIWICLLVMDNIMWYEVVFWTSLGSFYVMKLLLLWRL